MHSDRSRLLTHLRLRVAAYLVLLVAVTPACLVYWRVQTNVQARDQARFNVIVGNVEAKFREELQLLAADLIAVSGFCEAQTNVAPGEWTTFLDRLDMLKRHPGIRSVGYAERVDATAAAALSARMIPIAPDFTIRPPPTQAVLFPTILVTQFTTNVSRRLGWDVYSETPRRAAIDALMEKGSPIATDKLSYWNNKDERDAEGFAIFAPVRLMGAGTNGILRGVIFSSVIPQRMFNELARRSFDPAVQVELYDGTAVAEAALLATTGGSPASAPHFSQTRATSVLNHTFLFRVRTLPEFRTYSQTQLPLAVLTCGLGISFLLFAIAWTQGSARSAADELNRRLRNSQDQLRGANVELERKIAEAKTTEGLLAYERDLLRTLLEHSPDSIYFKDHESRFIKCGRALLQHLGVASVAEAEGRTDFDFFTPKHAQAAFECEQEIIRTGEPVIGLVEKETWPTGEETWVLTSKMPLRDKHGGIIGTFGITKDITKLKAIELALAKEKDLLAVTLRSIADGVITTDVEGRIVLFNEVAERLTGWTQAVVVGRLLKSVFRTRGLGESNTETLHRTLDGGSSPPVRETILIACDGSERNISQSLAPIINGAGHTIGAVVVFRDITEKLKTEAELQKASKLESIGVLAGGIAHDFNNILTVILGNISLARLALSTGRSTSEALAEAEKASLRARELTQRLLTFARGGSPIKKPIHLAPLTRECAARALQGSNVVTEFFLGENLWTVQADEAQIVQVMQNLISHARATMSKDPRLDIHVLNQEMASDPLLFLRPGPYVRVSIRDYGAGLQQENLTKIFEPYFGPKHQGNGLELATAYSIVRKHEGQIRVESIPGQGTVFHVYLPATAAPVLPAVQEPRSARRSGRPQHVLVMDDELPIRTLAVHLLQRIGCTAVTAADGAEAIELYESARRGGKPFGAVIMDLTVPNGMGGKETIRELRALDPDVLAIVSSGYSNDPVMANYRDFGFAGVVPKPYSGEDLAAALDDLFPGLKEAPADRPS
jgi:PAS domain S-box-containing protein